MSLPKNDLEKAFTVAYNKLNVSQKLAVDTIEGPVLVMAGPGTGKTQVLTLRIANILAKTDTKPESILALTFTESGARNLKERLREFIGVTAYQVNAYTFHSFCEQLIRRYPDAYPTILGGRPARELERVAIIEEILMAPEFKILRPMGKPTYYVSAIIRELSNLKREYHFADSLALIIGKQEVQLANTPKLHIKGAHQGKVRSEYQTLQKIINKNRELLLVYRQYESSLRAQSLYDFDDMIIETIKAFENNEDMLRDQQETYQYLLADEHQDVNGSQNRILELLANYHPRPNLFVVGDEKQAIFRFQGASLENFLYFENTFPNTKTIALTENYRSGQPILDVAHSLIAVTEGPLRDLRLPLKAKTKIANIKLAEFSQLVVETKWVTSTIEKLIADGTPKNEIAIIVRTNREVEHYATALKNLSLPVEASADSDILYHPITKAVVDLLSAVSETHNEAVLFKVLQAPYWQIPIADIFILSNARSLAMPLSKLLFDVKSLTALPLSDIEAVKKIGEVVTQARNATLTEAPQRVLQSLINDSGLLTATIKESPLEGVRVLRRLYDEVESLVTINEKATLSDLAATLRALQEHQVALTAPYLTTESEAIKVMTAHKAKGLEFSYVFIPGLVDSKWGGASVKNTFNIPLTKHLTSDLVDESDDDRRLLYVAFTRAKTGLYLSYAKVNGEGKEQLLTRLLNVDEEPLIEQVATREFEAQFNLQDSLQSVARTPSLPLSFFVKVLSERGFSATAFNNYLTSPWDYIYRNVLRIPEVQSLSLQYGNAIHSVLEKCTNYYNNQGKWVSSSQINKSLKQALERLPLTVAEVTRLHQQGLEELVVYLEHIKQSLPKRSVAEFKLRVNFPTGLPELPEIPLTGKFDRLDFGEDGKLKRVVDYKTGVPKSRNVIEGKTKNADGNYKRQLVFYALLLSLSKDERYQCTEGVLSFVRPDAKGKIHEETFVITNEEIKELKLLIIKAVTEIVTGDFLLQPCDPDKSNYCELAKQLLR